MGAIYIIFLIGLSGLIIYLIVKVVNKTTNIRKIPTKTPEEQKAQFQNSIQQTTQDSEPPYDRKFTKTFSSETPSPDYDKIDPIKQDEDGNWILNPGVPFELTLMNADEKLAQEIRDLLDDDDIRYKRKDYKLVALFAGNNLEIKEIEEYKNKYKKLYLQKIEELKNSTPDWSELEPADRDDLFKGFKKIAIKSLYERANCDLLVLFENEPKQCSLDDKLIKEYGFEIIRTYLAYAVNIEKTHIIPVDYYSRPTFEKLVEFGLAKNGYDLSSYEILSALNINNLNIIADNPKKEYIRKNQAIEYILTLDDLDQRISKHISRNDIFKINPLPEKYNSINIQELAITWNYHTEKVRLLMDTYLNSFYKRREIMDDKYVAAYIIKPSTAFEDPCPCSVDRSKKKYPKDNPPKIPCHVGCSCMLYKEYDFG